MGSQNPLKPFVALVAAGITLSVLKRTVLDSGLHCPTTTLSPSRTRKHGDRCALRFECRFSYRMYLRTVGYACVGYA